MQKDTVQYSEDSKESLGLLFRLRLPPLVVGLVLGLGLSFATSRFEEVLDTHISVAFFIPFVIYLADAVGSQTQTVYIRSFKVGSHNFKKYLFKETMLGLMLGLIFAVATFVIVMLWYGSMELTWAVSLSMFFAILVSPPITLFVTRFLQVEHTDPAVSAGPISTVIQDAASIVIYGLVSSFILL